MIRLVVYSYALTWLAGCVSTPDLKITAIEPATVSIVSPKSPDKVIKKLGTTPANVDLKLAKGNLIKLTQPGRLPQYIFPFALDTPKLEIQVKLRSLSEVPEIHEERDAIVDPNITHRLLMQAYDALIREGNLDQAMIYADEIIKLSKRLAAPRIIRGLIFLQRGDGEKAKREFQAARDLDPQDSRIDSLLKAANEGL